MDTPVAHVPGSASGSPYDETPYPSSSFPGTHPDKLCAMGRLFGLQPAAPATARVLEIGCADGANLLPMAAHAPGARFLGIDGSAKQVASAQEAITASGLTNVEVRHLNILDFPVSEGKFDYIIAHGVYSWVPAEVREKILSICREHLTEQGIAYVSYNAYPGWGMRMSLRDMMLFHTVSFPDGKTKVAQARALTTFLSEAVAAENNPYGMLLKQELQAMASQPDGYIRHDLLAEINQPFYFREFVQQAMQAGLQYVGETTLDQMLASNFPEKVTKTLDEIAGNIIAKEQYMDFVRNRNFRRTLLCHANLELKRALSPESVRSFFYTSRFAKPEPGTLDLRQGVNHAFKLRAGGDVAVNAENGFLKAAFDVLSECALQRISFDELLTAARQRSMAVNGPASAEEASVQEATLRANLLPLYVRGIIDIFADRPRLKTAAPEKPEVTALVRYQAAHARNITGRTHDPFPVDILGRLVLEACDGQRDRAGIVEHLVAAAKSGRLKMNENDQPVTDPARMQLILADRVERVLTQIAAYGFLSE